LYDYLQGVQAYLAPPIFVVFFMGVFNKRLNAKGAMAALLTGFGMGILRLAIDTPIKLIENFAYDPGSFLWILNNIFFQYYSLLITIVATIVMVVVSYMTEEPDYKKIDGLTYSTTSADDKKKTRESWTKLDVFTSASVIVLIVFAYLYFTG
jgi:SSS family solute:Na+ symporter